jgi:4-hydroxybenzoate adenylyltransferase
MSPTVTSHLFTRARENGWLNWTAYVDDVDRWTFADVFDGASRAAAGYRAAGLQTGDRALLALPDSIELVWCVLGAWQIGVVAVPVNVQMSDDDLVRDAATAEPALIVVDSEAPLWIGRTTAREVWAAESLVGGERLDDEGQGGTAPALAVFTSGTTGAPKLCFFRHDDLCSAALPDRFGRRAGEVGLSLSRMYFFGGLGITLLNTLELGLTAVLSRPRATPARALELIRRHDVVNLFAQPSLYARMSLEPGHEETLRGLRLAMCAGEVLPVEVLRRLLPLLGDRLLNVYGATEVGGIVVAGRPADHEDPSTIGFPFPDRPVRIVDPAEQDPPLDAGFGELQIHVPSAVMGVSRGSTGPKRLEDVWWSSGDLASLDADGALRVHGRLDDVEVIGGQNVVPGEVERLLESHPAVHEAAVSAVRLPAGDTRLRAYVVPVVDVEPELGAELIDLAGAHLSWFKVPTDVVFLGSLPRNGNGKLLRRRLRIAGEQFVG